MLFGIEFSSIAFITSSVTLRKREAPIWEFSTPVVITSRELILSRYDAILDQSERVHLYSRDKYAPAPPGAKAIDDLTFPPRSFLGYPLSVVQARSHFFISAWKSRYRCFFWRLFSCLPWLAQGKALLSLQVRLVSVTLLSSYSLKESSHTNRSYFSYERK